MHARRVGDYAASVGAMHGTGWGLLIQGALWEAGAGDLERLCLRVVPVYQQPPEAQRAQQPVAQGLHMPAGRSEAYSPWPCLHARATGLLTTDTY